MAAPSIPNRINVPDNIGFDEECVITWEKSTDPDNNLVGYKLERKFSNTAYEQVADIRKESPLTFTETLWDPSSDIDPEILEWVKYRVKAYDSAGEESGYKESEKINFAFAAPPPPPPPAPPPEEIEPPIEDEDPPAIADNQIIHTTLERRNNENGWDKLLLQTSADITYIGKQIVNGNIDIGQIHAGLTLEESETVENVIKMILSKCEPPKYKAPESSVFLLFDDNTLQPIGDITGINSDFPRETVSFKLYIHNIKNDGGNVSVPKTFINGSTVGDKIPTTASSEQIELINTAITEENYGTDVDKIREIVETFSQDTDYILDITDYEISNDITDIYFKTDFAQGPIKQDNHDKDYPEGRIEACTIESGHLSLIPQLISLEFINESNVGENINVFDDVGTNLKELVNGVFVTAPTGTKTVRFKIPTNAISDLKIFDDLVRDISKVFTKTEEGDDSSIKFNVYTLSLSQPFPVDTVIYFENGISTQYKKWYY